METIKSVVGQILPVIAIQVVVTTEDFHQISGIIITRTPKKLPTNGLELRDVRTTLILKINQKLQSTIENLILLNLIARESQMTNILARDIVLLILENDLQAGTEQPRNPM